MGVAAILLVLASGAAAQAPGVSIAPTAIVLAPSHITEMLRLRNRGGEEIRYQVSASNWEQTADGRQLLHPTEDLIFFPPLFTVKPGDEQIIRVAAGVPFGLKEKSYRLFIEQLPPLTTPNREQGAAVTLLMRMGLPVFLQPASILDGATMGATEFRGGTVRFRLENSGNVHLVASEVKVSGLGSDGRAVFEHSATPSYVPAGGSLDFNLPISRSECGQIHTLSLTVKTEQRAPGREVNVKRAEITRSLNLGPGDCGR